MKKTSAQLEEIHTQAPYPLIRSAWAAGIAALEPSAARLEHGLTLHRQVPVIDTFGFLPLVYHPDSLPLLDAIRASGIGARDFAFEYTLLRRRSALAHPEGLKEFIYALAASGLSGMLLTMAEGKTREEDIKLMTTQAAMMRTARAGIGQSGSIEEFHEIRSQERMGIFGSVNGPPLASALRDPREEFAWLQTWHDLGVRAMHLTYNRRNAVGDGCAETSNAGLSDLGEHLVNELNRLGIIIDVPHSGTQTCLDACRLSTKPVMASHTGRKAFHDHPRNKSDDVIKAIADTGGVVGVVALPGILGKNGDLPSLLDALDDMVSLIGVDHVALATDYCYRSPGPDSFLHGSLAGADFKPSWWGETSSTAAGKAGRSRPKSPSGDQFGGCLAWTNWPLFTVGLVIRGYSDDEVAKILGGNFLRVLNDQNSEPTSSTLPQ